DRAPLPLTISTEALHTARARVKKDKFRVLTLEPPVPDKLPTAVQAGIWDCIKLYTEKPPKGSKNNFGLAAYHHWVKLLTKPKTRLSWAREFPAGRKMLAGLMGVFNDINHFGKVGYAERDMYANFLDEASLILEKPALQEAAVHFRQSAKAWETFSQALLPSDVPMLGEVAQNLRQQQELWLNKGSEAAAEIIQLKEQEKTLLTLAETEFPLDEKGTEAFRINMVEHILRIHDIEETAVSTLREAIL
ncbi:hypothetical protein MNBD_CHLOROFLEXI01-298, partial [hydrothermal vent metagenome]